MSPFCFSLLRTKKKIKQFVSYIHLEVESNNWLRLLYKKKSLQNSTLQLIKKIYINTDIVQESRSLVHILIKASL